MFIVQARGDLVVRCSCLQLHETVQLAADNQDAAAQRASLQGTSRQSAVDSQRRAASAALQHSAFYRYQQQEQDRRRSSIDQGGGGRQGGESSLPWLRKEPSDAAPDRQVSCRFSVSGRSSVHDGTILTYLGFDERIKQMFIAIQNLQLRCHFLMC